MTTQAEAILEKCKDEAKRLVGYSTAVRRMHWSYSCVVSFCVAVEEVVSYGVKKKYQTSFSLGGASPPPSVKVLKDLAGSQQYGLASDLWKKAVEESRKERSERERKDRAAYPAQFLLEGKILWVKLALVDKTLLDYIDLLIGLRKHFYTKGSILGDATHSDIFRNLLAGPLVLKITRMKISDDFFATPSPHELVHRHAVFDKKKTSGNASTHQDISDEMDLWSHVKSLYQCPGATCLYGKNSIMKKLAHSTYPKFCPGYLSLHQGRKLGLQLKWLPIDILNCTQEDPDAELTLKESLKYVMTCDINKDVAHIHCHRTPDNQYFMILVGYDGIASAPLIFSHQSSLLAFLECVDSGLLPQGCLEPPVWFIKSQIGVSPIDDKEPELAEHWNQVFHVRTTHRRIQEEPILQQSVRDAMMTEEDIEALQRIGMEDWREDSAGPSPTSRGHGEGSLHSERPLITALIKAKRAVNKERLESFQSKVQRPLVARYFYSWLSYCRHMSKARKRVSHMLDTHLGLPPKPSASGDVQLGREQWDRIKSNPSSSDQKELYNQVYLAGMDDAVRSEVWPYLLGVYRLGSSVEELKQAAHKQQEAYAANVRSWTQLEDAESTLKDLMKKLREVEWTDGLSDNRQSDELFSCMYSDSDVLSARDGTLLGCEESERPQSSEAGGREGVCSPRLDSTESVSQVNGVDGDSRSSEADTSTALVDVELQLKCEKDSRVNVLKEIDQWYDKLPQGTKEKLKSDEDGQWSYQRFLELPDIQYLTSQLMQLDKDVRRCDRDLEYFKEQENLSKVRKIVMSYCWIHQELGYVQGMCDMLAPLLCLLDDEVLAYHCFLKVMDRVESHFPPNNGVSIKLSNLRALVEVMEPEFFLYLSQEATGDDFLFAYRWFLLDFKREFGYSHIFRLWEVITCSVHCASPLFQEFLAVALIKKYMAIIMSAKMDSNDILHLFNGLCACMLCHLLSSRVRMHITYFHCKLSFTSLVHESIPIPARTSIMIL